MGAKSEPFYDKTLYLTTIGKLMYLMRTTRPDIPFAITRLARYSQAPTKLHWESLMRVIRYLQATKNYKLKLGGKEVREKLLKGEIKVNCYTDADYGGDLTTGRSTTGVLVMLGYNLVSWTSKLQSVVSNSTVESEYYAIGQGVKVGIALQELLKEMSIKVDPQVLVRTDNQAAKSIAEKLQFTDKAKHIRIKEMFVRYYVERNEVRIDYCETEKMLADFLTKSLPTSRHNDLIKNNILYING